MRGELKANGWMDMVAKQNSAVCIVKFAIVIRMHIIAIVVVSSSAFVNHQSCSSTCTCQICSCGATLPIEFPEYLVDGRNT